MFEDLKQHITKENMHKIRQTNRPKERYADDALSLSDYQFQERQENFQAIMENQEVVAELRKSHNFRTPQNRNKYLERELQLSQEKLKIQEKMHQTELRLFTEQFQREIYALKIENENKTIQLNHYIKDQKLVDSLRRDNRLLMDNKQEVERRQQETMHQNQILRSKIEAVERKLAESQSKSEGKRAISIESELKQSIRQLEYQVEVCKQKNTSLEYQNKQLRNQMATIKRTQQEIQVKAQEEREKRDLIYSQQIGKLEDINRDLQQKNKILEESLMEHLSQTSKYLYQKEQTTWKKESITAPEIDSTLNLKDETPIRSDRKPQKKSVSFEDPEKTVEGQYKIKYHKVTTKLRQANTKIVELLQQKCRERIPSVY